MLHRSRCQQAAQLPDGAKQVDTNGRFADAERLADLVRALLGDLTEREHEPLPLGKLLDRRQNPLPAFARQQPLFRCLLRSRGLRGECLA